MADEANVQTDGGTGEETSQATQTESLPAPASIKVGDKDIPVADIVKRISWLDENAETLKNLDPMIKAINAKDRNGVTKLLDSWIPAGEPPPKPEDVQGRLTQLERDRQQHQDESEADTIIRETMKEIGEGFKPEAALDLLTNSGFQFNRQTFKNQLQLANRALQYDELKTKFDDAVKVGVKAELERQQKEAAANKLNGGGDNQHVDSKDWSGDPVEVAKRQGIYDKI